MEELENIKKQFDELMAKAEEIVKKNEKEDERWRAGRGEAYWYVGPRFSRLDAFSDTEVLGDIDSRRWAAGNYFKTKEEAKKVAQHIRDYLILRADAKGYEPKNISLDAHYCFVFWSAGNECLETYDDGGSLSGTIYFETGEDAEASIKKHGDIWKRYLGVEE
jgi:hypothetical protein